MCFVPTTETENLGIRILSAAGEVEIDGKFADWDLSGGVFVCGDVEHQREQPREQPGDRLGGRRGLRTAA